MSASKKKRERQSLYENGVLDKNPELTIRARNRKKTRKIVTVTTAVVVALGVCAGLFFSGFLARHATAVTVGTYKLPPSMFSYYYRDAYLAFQEQNKDYLDMIMDTKKPLTGQTYNEEEGLTWADFFVGEGKTSAAQTLALYDAAMLDGFALSEEAELSLTNLRADLEAYASLLQLESAEDYIQTIYGSAATLDEYLSYSRTRLVASSYAADYKAALSYSNETLRDAYAATPNDFDKVSYKVFYVTKTIGENEDGTLRADMAASEQMARDMADACKGDVDRFNELSLELAEEKRKEIYRDPEYTTRTNYTISQATQPLQQWLADEDRQYGDTTFVQADERAYYVGFFISRGNLDLRLPALRMTKVTAVANAENTLDPAGMVSAGEIAGTILAQYEAGEKTAAGFNAAVDAARIENAAVSAAAAQENFTPGTLDGVQDDWCFTAARKSGDAIALAGSDGYYVLYFDQFGPVYRDYLVDTKLRNADYETWYQQVISTYTAESSGYGLFFVDKA